MSILNFLFGSNDHEAFYSDTNSEGEEDVYMYRLESDGTTTPVSKDEYKAHTDQLYKQGYYDDIIARLEDDKPKKSWWALW